MGSYGIHDHNAQLHRCSICLAVKVAKYYLYKKQKAMIALKKHATLLMFDKYLELSSKKILLAAVKFNDLTNPEAK